MTQKFYIIICFVWLIHLVCNAQIGENVNDALYPNKEIIMPEFPGGVKKLIEFLSKNTFYPEEAIKAKKEGRVLVQFIVEKDGSISNPSVMVSANNALLDAEAVRVVNSMPKWKPGRHRGKSVRVKYNIPISFRMPKNEDISDNSLMKAGAIVATGAMVYGLGKLIVNGAKSSFGSGSSYSPSYSSSSSSSSSKSSSSSSTSIDIERITLSDFKYQFDGDWMETISPKRYVKFEDKEDSYGGYLFRTNGGDLYISTDGLNDFYYNNMENAIIALYVLKKYNKIRETGRK